METKAAVEEEEAEAEPQEADVKEAVSQAKEGRQEAPTVFWSPRQPRKQAPTPPRVVPLRKSSLPTDIESLGWGPWPQAAF